MVQYCRDMWPISCNILDHLTEAAIGPKGGNFFLNDALKSLLKEIKRMVSTETLLIYPYWKLQFTVHTDASDKQLCAVISQSNKPITFFSRKLSKPKRNYTTTKKELLAIV